MSSHLRDDPRLDEWQTVSTTPSRGRQFAGQYSLSPAGGSRLAHSYIMTTGIAQRMNEQTFENAIGVIHWTAAAPARRVGLRSLPALVDARRGQGPQPPPVPPHHQARGSRGAHSNGTYPPCPPSDRRPQQHAANFVVALRGARIGPHPIHRRQNEGHSPREPACKHCRTHSVSASAPQDKLFIKQRMANGNGGDRELTRAIFRAP